MASVPLNPSTALEAGDRFELPASPQAERLPLPDYFRSQGSLPRSRNAGSS